MQFVRYNKPQSVTCLLFQHVANDANDSLLRAARGRKEETRLIEYRPILTEAPLQLLQGSLGVIELVVGGVVQPDDARQRIEHQVQVAPGVGGACALVPELSAGDAKDPAAVAQRDQDRGPGGSATRSDIGR